MPIENDNRLGQSSSSGGSGGIFGNASASLGDVGIGTSSATSGNIGAVSFGGMSYSPGISQKEMITYGLAGVALLAVYALIKKKVK